MKSVHNCSENNDLSTWNPIGLLEKLLVGSGLLAFIGIVAFLILFAVMYFI